MFCNCSVQYLHESEMYGYLQEDELLENSNCSYILSLLLLKALETPEINKESFLLNKYGKKLSME